MMYEGLDALSQICDMEGYVSSKLPLDDDNMNMNEDVHDDMNLLESACQIIQGTQGHGVKKILLMRKMVMMK